MVATHIYPRAESLPSLSHATLAPFPADVISSHRVMGGSRENKRRVVDAPSTLPRRPDSEDSFRASFELNPSYSAAILKLRGSSRIKPACVVGAHTPARSRIQPQSGCAKYGHAAYYIHSLTGLAFLTRRLILPIIPDRLSGVDAVGAGE
jgi:hypothetical protein